MSLQDKLAELPCMLGLPLQKREQICNEVANLLLISIEAAARKKPQKKAPPKKKTK